MRGVTRRLEREGEAALTACWQTGAFTGQAMAGKLKKLAHYRRKTNTGPAIASNSEILARFGAMAERGLDVAVT